MMRWSNLKKYIGFINIVLLVMILLFLIYIRKFQYIYEKKLNSFKTEWIFRQMLNLECTNESLEELFKKEIKSEVISVVLVDIFCIFIMTITGMLLIQIYKIKRNKTLKEKIAILDQHYHILEKKYIKTNNILHDIKNHMICIYYLAEEGEGQELLDYITQLDYDIKSLSYTVITSNKVLDIIINEKITEMKKYDIEFTYEFQDLYIGFIENKDLVGIISNILDNAIESAKSSQKKNIKMKLYSYNNSFILIKIINSCDITPQIKEKKFLTRKEDKESHGYGVEIIKRTVKKYRGNFKWSYEEDKKEFIALIILPYE